MKYVDTAVTFAEVPNEITLCINISNCPCQCEGCHSSYLAQDIGTVLTNEELDKLIEANSGVTCISFMGGDADPVEVTRAAKHIKQTYDTKYKVCWYSGRQKLSELINLKYFDFVKLGPYKEECGPLNNPDTNQRFYEVNRLSKMPPSFKLTDITNLFWTTKN